MKLDKLEEQQAEFCSMMRCWMLSRGAGATQDKDILTTPVDSADQLRELNDRLEKEKDLRKKMVIILFLAL